MTDSLAPPESPAYLETDEVPERAHRIFARLWQFETWLRRMVYIELRALLGDDWSNSLPANSRSFEADKHLKHMPTPEMNALSYSSLSNLTRLVRGHWDYFAPYLPPQALWDAKLAEVSQIRHRIAHFRVGHADDHPRLIQFLRDVDKGFWSFCTSYNDADPILPQSEDPVTAHFLPLDPLPWGEIAPQKWARVGHVDKSELIGLTVEVLTRPWANSSHQVHGRPGYLYDINMMAHDGRRFDYARLLERSLKLHDHLAHICLGDHEGALRLTVPTLLGATKVIALVEELLEIARSNVNRSRNPIAPNADALADEWPEYVLGPRDPLAFLDPQMKCTFFGV
jgi:hypothetical protein